MFALFRRRCDCQLYFLFRFLSLQIWYSTSTLWHCNMTGFSNVFKPSRFLIYSLKNIFGEQAITCSDLIGNVQECVYAYKPVLGSWDQDFEKLSTESLGNWNSFETVRKLRPCPLIFFSITTLSIPTMPRNTYIKANVFNVFDWVSREKLSSKRKNQVSPTFRKLHVRHSVA